MSFTCFAYPTARQALVEKRPCFTLPDGRGTVLLEDRKGISMQLKMKPNEHFNIIIPVHCFVLEKVRTSYHLPV